MSYTMSQEAEDQPVATPMECDSASDSDSDCGDSDSDSEIDVILEMPDLSKMAPAEREAYERQFKVCAYCESIGKDEQTYRGHTKEECRILQNTRCNWCAGYGHTGKYCDNKGEEPLEIRCMFCFRAKMDERFYMSHSQDRCRFKREYEMARQNGLPIPKRPRSTQQGDHRVPKRVHQAIPTVDKPSDDLSQLVGGLSLNSTKPTDNQEYDPENPRLVYHHPNIPCSPKIKPMSQILQELQEENQRLLAQLRL